MKITSGIDDPLLQKSSLAINRLVLIHRRDPRRNGSWKGDLRRWAVAQTAPVNLVAAF